MQTEAKSNCESLLAEVEILSEQCVRLQGEKMAAESERDAVVLMCRELLGLVVSWRRLYEKLKERS